MNASGIGGFQKGQTGNAGGRPKRDKIITQKLISRLTENDCAKLNEFVDCLLAEAASGDVPAMREIIDRIEGKATQPMEHSGKVEVEHSGAAELLSSRVAGVAARLGTREPAQITH